MPSPFPGMDPYLERSSWPDFHAIFLVALRTAFNRLLPAGYQAQIDERVALIEEEFRTKIVEPDVAIEHDPRNNPNQNISSGGAATAMLAPVKIPLISYVEVVERRIEIVKQPTRELVTIIEVLSPSNKSPGAGHAEYLAKRLQIIRQSVNLVELDLLLGGKRIQLSRPSPPGDYYAYISRADDRPNCDVYAWALSDPLPAIPIPLRLADGDLRLELASVFVAAFEIGDYQRRADFREILPESIPVASQKWVADIAKSASPV